MEHRARDYPYRPDQVPAPTSTPASGTVQPPRVALQSPRDRGIARGGNDFGRGQRAPGRGAVQTKARQLVLVYMTRHHDDRNDANVIVGTFFIYSVQYFALINIGSTHSNVSSIISIILGISIEYTTGEVFVINPLG